MGWLVHFLDWFCLRGRGYQWWSGAGAGSPVFALAIGWVVHHNCHVKRCPFLGHPDPEHGHPACRRHHSQAHRLD